MPFLPGQVKLPAMAMKKSDGTEKRSNNITLTERSGYFVRTARAVYALVFLLPLIIIYEVLVFVVNPQLLTEHVSNVRGAVVSFVWVQNFLHYLGMNTKFAWLFAPVVVIAILLILQLASRQRWKVKLSDFPVMAAECLIFAIPLIILALVLNRGPNRQQSAFNNSDAVMTCSAYSSGAAGENNFYRLGSNGQGTHAGSIRDSIAMDLLTGIGAGIYEELIFRLILISLSMIFFETILGIRRVRAVIISVILSSVLFSLHHHFVFLNGQFTRTADIFTVTRFAFRTVAGVFFAIIFAVRGFGIAAGTHSLYDVIATLLNAWLFEQY